MMEGTDPIFISGYLMFYNHGSCHYKASLSSRLVFKARVESQTPKTCIKAWLELTTGSVQEMVLPMNSLQALAQDTNGLKTLTELFAYYKSRTRKRSRPVVP